MKTKFVQPYVFFFLICAAACAPAQVPQAEAPSEGPAAVDVSMHVPAAEGEPVTDLPDPVAVELTTYTDPTYGYTFDYPSAWMLDAVVYGSRAPGGYQITSWQHEPGQISEVLPDGTVVNIVLQLWDPKADLPAFIEQRKFAWVNSGIEIIFDEYVMLAGEKTAREFVTVSQGERGYTLFTTLGENYLVVSGTGDLEAVRSVAWSLR